MPGYWNAHSDRDFEDPLGLNEKRIVGQCDCCGAESRELYFRIAYGIETYACAECCGIEEEDDG